MANIQHQALDYSEVHVPHSYEYANAAARTGASGFVSADIGKLALQTDDTSLWMLTATTPTWVAAIITGAITVDTISEDTPAAGVTIDGVLCKDSAVTASAGFIGDLTGAVTGTSTGDHIGDIKSSNDTKILENGTDGSDATFRGDVLDASSYSRLIPTGGIILWSGAISAIPNGWYICDGTNGTPNLTDKFVIHADADSGGTRDVGDTGGAHTHTLTTAETPAHTHTITAKRTSVVGSSTGIDMTNNVTTSNNTTAVSASTVGSGDAHNNMPAYYALAYIMKA
jgi:microcystin-dependent protein